MVNFLPLQKIFWGYSPSSERNGTCRARRKRGVSGWHVGLHLLPAVSGLVLLLRRHSGTVPPILASPQVGAPRNNPCRLCPSTYTNIQNTINCLKKYGKVRSQMFRWQLFKLHQKKIFENSKQFISINRICH